jgi:hypothetical protein
MNATPWFWPIGRPNWTRVREYSAAYSTAARATPTAIAATPGREASNVFIDHLTRRQRNLVLQEMADVMEDVFAERRERARVFEAGDLSVASQAQALRRPGS